MNLLIIATLAAVCSAAKLDRTYLPPASARTAGGSEASLQTPNAFSQNAAPKGSYTNDFQGVVVDAALAGTRGASGSEESGLGASRDSYGSTASKVGEAAFRGAQAGFRFPQGFGPNSAFAPQRQETDFEARESEGVELSGEPQFEDSRPERPQAAQERAANTLRFDSEVGVESFNYAFETDNGISAEETGTATNGVQAQGGYSYTGDDGKVYTVTYTADEGGYQPRGDHLPTPPPIPEEILKSLEQNARDEANGVVDDGMYDAQKYNAGGDYAESDSANGRQNGGPSAGAGNTDVDASGSFINQKHQPFNPNRHGDNDNTVNQFASQNNANRFGSRNEYLPPFQQTQNQRQQSNRDTSDADSSSTFQHESTEGSGNVQSQSQQNRPTSQSFASRPTSNQFNSFKQSTNGNQVNQNGNRSPMNRQQFGSAANTGSQDGRKQFSAHASPTFNSQHATSVPDTELTTPFETNPQDAQSAQSSAPSTNSLGFHNQPSHNGQSHFASQNSHFETSQAPAQPTIPSFPQSKPQNSNNRPVSGNRNTQSGFSTQAPRQQEQFSQQSAFGGKRPQFSQNQFSQTSDSQFSPSTPRPQFAQQATGQDDSYYYNQPTRTFNAPQSPSRFSNAPANQFDRVTQRPSSSQTPQEEEENYPSTAISSQNGQRQGQAPFRRPSFPTQSTPSDSQFQSNSISSATNGITQASASPFPAPTSAPSSNGQHSSHSRQQFQHSTFQSSRPSSPQPSKPSFSAQSTSRSQSSGDLSSQFEKQNFESAKPLSQQPLQEVKEIKLDDDTKPEAPVTNLQYNGEVYEYTKPAEMLPPPENGFGQFGTKIPSAQKPTDSQPQIGQSDSAQATSQRQFGQSTNSAQATAQTFAPQSTQFTQSAKTQQGNQFGSRPQFGQATASAQASSKPFAPQPTQFSQSAQGSRQFGSRPQFGQSVTSSQQASESFAPQPTKFSQSAKTSQGSQSGSRPQFGQSTTASQQATSESFAPQPTQFSQSAKTQQNTFGSRPQFGASSHSQSQQSSFGSKPQFGQATQGDQFSAQTQESTDEFDAKPAQQFNAQSQTEQHSNQFQRRPSQGSIAAETPKPFSQGSPCCNGAFGQQPSFGKPSQDSSIASSFQSSSFKPAQTSSVAGKGEVFGGPRAPPSFDDTGYHY
ncbi:dentin sialophosphoprotein-like [Leguminivora glycinivorella]|uniref:dentin sialophosphoprotein-like n=1 Tax=Leguminivora glycinivorella TaxID=1035111 RepID=UPI00200D6A09|nr:dentin sialophosphoprotein-like [Leguminivora glycinivorella]